MDYLRILTGGSWLVWCIMELLYCLTNSFFFSKFVFELQFYVQKYSPGQGSLHVRSAIFLSLDSLWAVFHPRMVRRRFWNVVCIMVNLTIRPFLDCFEFYFSSLVRIQNSQTTHKISTPLPYKNIKSRTLLWIWSIYSHSSISTSSTVPFFGVMNHTNLIGFLN